jgi:hypothetical protein
MRAAQTVAGIAYVGMSAAFVWWNWRAFGDPSKLLLVLPLVVASAFVFRRSVRPLVAAGTLALPYLCFAIVEIVAANAMRLAPIVALACGVVFMTLLAPVTRNARRQALARGRHKS